MIDIDPARLIAQHLIDQAIAVAVGGGDWTVYIGQMAETPDKAICTYGTQAMDDGRMPDGERVEHPGFLVAIRSKDQESGYAKGAAIRNALDAIKNTVVTVNFVAYTIHSVRRTTSLLPLGVDPETRLVNFTLNAEMTVT